jgi:hypothetical protein
MHGARRGPDFVSTLLARASSARRDADRLVVFV